MQLQLECTNVCNAECVFCPYPKMKRAKGTMTMELFRKIIDDAITIPQIDHVTITGLGEPFLDRFMIDRVRYVRDRMPSALIDLYTNGSMLHRHGLVDRLHDAGLSVLYVSLNAASADSRLAVMKLDDWDRVNEGIRYAMTHPRWKVLVKGIVSKDLMSGDDNDRFMSAWNGSYREGGNAFLHLEGNWAGAMYPMRVQLKDACDRALSQIMVLRDGRVSLCCFDSEGDCILGDLNHQSIREVFNGDTAVGIRMAHVEGRRAEIPLCANCTGI